MNTKPHRYSLHFLLVLFFSVTNLLSYSQEGDTLIAEDILDLSLEEMMNMEVVSASKIKQKIFEVPATIRVITAQQIRERGYYTLEQALADLPGFQFRNINGFNTYSFLRGVPSQNNLILLMIDGVQINELNSGGFYGGAQYDLANAERIEVVYGPASALYGTNSVSGIINIITKKPEKNNSGAVSATSGGFDTYAADLGYEWASKNENLGFRISSMYKTSEKANLKGAAGDYNWGANMENFENDLALNAFFHFKNLSAGITYLKKSSSRTTNYQSTGDQYLDHGTLWNIGFFNAYIKHTITKEKWSDFLQCYFRNSTVMDNTVAYIIKADDNSDGYQAGYYRPNNLAGAEGQFNYYPDQKMILTGGMVLENEWLATSFSETFSTGQDIRPPAPGKPGQLRNHLISVYFQGQYEISPLLIFTAGARQDYSSYYDFVFTPRMALIFNYKRFTSKLMFNEAYRAPKPWDYTSGTGNENLNPEKMKSVEYFFLYNISASLSFEASVYYNMLSKLLVKEVEPEQTYWRWINKDKVNTLGFETGLNFRKKGFSIFVYYSLNNSEDQDGNILQEISKHVVNSAITAHIYRNVYLHIGAYYYGKRTNPSLIPLTNNYTIDGAFILNSTLSLLSFKNFDLQLMINNILNTEYYHSSNRPPARYRQPQRNVLVKITYHFNKK